MVEQHYYLGHHEEGHPHALPVEGVAPGLYEGREDLVGHAVADDVHVAEPYFH